MRLITYSIPFSNPNLAWSIKGKRTGARLAVHLNDFLDCFELTNGCPLGIMTNNASSNYLMTRELQSTLEASGFEWPALQDHIPCMAHFIQLAFCAIMSRLGVEGCTESRDAHNHDQHFEENATMDIWKSQQLRNEGNARINKVLAMRPGLAKIVEKVCISIFFESPETDLHIGENACGIDYAATWLSKRVHWLLKSQSTNHSATYHGSENMVEFDTRVDSTGLPISTIHPQVSPESKR